MNIIARAALYLYDGSQAAPIFPDKVGKPGDVVRHFKGNRYQILYFAKDSETQEDVVVYRALYGERGVWVRPMGMFFSLVDKVKYPDVKQVYRFERVGEDA